jgi:predicted ArsR family transcriptional regulator
MTMDDGRFEAQVRGIAALDNPITRRAYQLVLEKEWVSRDEAAGVLGLARSVAAFHLEKLVDAGLLVPRFERLSGRTGPGAGRPAKLYGRSAEEIEISLPPRRYDLAGALLAEAISRATSRGTPVSEAVEEVAREGGERIGREAKLRRGRASRWTALLDVLKRIGFVPKRRGQQIALLNCPFHSLAQEQRHLVCSMNVNFVDGIVNGLDEGEALDAVLAPEEGYCCVRVNAR